MKKLLTVSLAYLMLLTPLLLVGCAKSESKAIATSEVVPTYVVSAKNGQIVCQATFQVGGVFGTYLELSEGEKVFCSDGERTVEMKKNETILNVVNYYSQNDLRYEVGREYSIILERQDGSRLVSSVSLPEELVVSAPVNGQIVRKGDSIPVRWNASKETSVEIMLDWSTPQGNSALRTRSSEDNGRFDFISEETKTKDTSGAPITGDVGASVEVVRIARKGVSPKFRSGSIAGKQSQTVRITLVD